jgi:hypothetical protein
MVRRVSTYTRVALAGFEATFCAGKIRPRSNSAEQFAPTAKDCCRKRRRGIATMSETSCVYGACANFAGSIAHSASKRLLRGAWQATDLPNVDCPESSSDCFGIRLWTAGASTASPSSRRVFHWRSTMLFPTTRLLSWWFPTERSGWLQQIARSGRLRKTG